MASDTHGFLRISKEGSMVMRVELRPSRDVRGLTSRVEDCVARGRLEVARLCELVGESRG
jgi:hypothetical protein